MITEYWDATEAYVSNGKLLDAIEYLEVGLAGCNGDRFKSLIGADFTNDPAAIVREIDEFIAFCGQSFDVRAVYLEMNGFDINPDRWYFDLFGYRAYIENLNNLNWLAHWDSPKWPDVTLIGLEQVQADYSDWLNKHDGNDLSEDHAWEYATLLVMCKFGNLIRRAVDTGITKQVPILATAHEFDIVSRFDLRPVDKAGRRQFTD